MEALLFKKFMAAPPSSALGVETPGVPDCEGDEVYAALHGAPEAGPAGDPGAPGPGARRLSNRLLSDLISFWRSFNTLACDSLFFSINCCIVTAVGRKSSEYEISDPLVIQKEIDKTSLGRASSLPGE